MNCLCSHTRHAARALTRAYEDHLRLAGLTAPQFELLSTLHFRPGRSQAQLSDFLGIDQTTLSRNLRLLVQRKWVKSARSKEDARQTTYTLTPLGERLWNDSHVLWLQANHQLRQALGDDFPAALALMNRIVAAVA